MQQTPRISVLQPESAIAQTPIRQSPDAIVRWNALTLDIIKTEKTSGPMAARNLAMVHAAIYDAANAIGLALVTRRVWHDCRAWSLSPSNASNLLVCRCALPSSSVLVRSTGFTSSYRLAIGHKPSLLIITC